jgi:Carboxypeptidase regulatory-like domain
MLSAVRLLALGLTAAGLAGAPTARAQDSTAAHRSHFGSLIGIVIDSLHNSVLVHAEVVIDGTNRSAHTDATGNFRIDNIPPGAFRVGVFHPLLDSIGLGIASPPLIARAGDSLLLTLATPSTVTVTARACRDVPTPVGVVGAPQSTGPGVVLGQILDADSDEPVRNVEVSFTWTEFEASRATGFHRTRHVRLATTGLGGDFHLCHLPLGVLGSLQAGRRDGGAAAAASTVSRELTPSALLTLVTMHMPALVTPTIATLAATATPQSSGAAAAATNGAPTPDASAPAPAPAKSTTGSLGRNGVPTSASAARRYATGVAVLTGEVLNPQVQPVARAKVFIMGAADSATTDDAGKFTLRNLPAGTRSLVVRSVGFEPVIKTVELSSREPVNLVVPFTARAVPSLAPVVVTARLDIGLKRVGFDLRQRAGVGTFWTLPDIDKHKAFDFHDLFTTFPGLKVDYNEQGQASLMATRGAGACIGYNNQGQATVGSNCGPCVAYVIDGQPFQENDEGELDNYIHPADIGAVEIYQDNEVPRSVSGTKSDCTNIVIWTKAKLGV